MNHHILAIAGVLLFTLCPCRGVLGDEGKTRSLFMPRELRERALENVRQDEGRRVCAIRSSSGLAPGWSCPTIRSGADVRAGNHPFLDGLVRRPLPRVRRERADVQLADGCHDPAVEDLVPALRGGVSDQ
jgi:hypothetical protein